MTDASQPFHAITISRLAHRLRAEGRSIVHMEFGQPSTGAPRLAVEAAHHRLDQPDMGYWENPQLRERLALYYEREHGVNVHPDRIILTCGASPALILALTTAFLLGDVVAMARPGHVSYRNALRILHITPMELACGHAKRFQLTAAALAALDPATSWTDIAQPMPATAS